MNLSESGYPGLRELHKKDDPILWDGHPARPCIISRQDACTTRNFGIFFYLEVSKGLTGLLFDG